MSYTCPKCSAPFISGTPICSTCGCDLLSEFIEKPICPECATTYAAGTKFCTKDGSTLVSEEDLVPRCSRCGTIYSSEIKFCPLDGGEIRTKWSNPIEKAEHNHPSEPTGLKPNASSGNTSDILVDLPTSFPKASLGNRFLAAIIDNIITLFLAVPGIVLIIVGVSPSEMEVGLIVLGVLSLSAPIIYGFIKDGLGQGQSWGKKVCQLMVINLATLQPCDKSTSFLRNFISGLVSLIPFVGGLIEPVMVLANEDGRKLGDRAANTQVINSSDYHPELLNQ